VQIPPVHPVMYTTTLANMQGSSSNMAGVGTRVFGSLQINGYGNHQRIPSRPGTSLGAVSESPVDVFAPGPGGSLSARGLGTPGLKDVLKVSFRPL
jgi:hypothetical protein